ncbi:MAG: hypothetical protein DIJKHBIC_04159 [Thermoanaerobaculia bacterium]|nr:hypothetical protein [Thermoanaerobaculia bacterium]
MSPFASSYLNALAALEPERHHVAAGDTAPVCLDCRQPVTPNELLCDPCFRAARKVVPLEELTRRREERRKRTEARLRSTPCPTCGRTDWHVTARGDAHCRACFRHGEAR